MEKGLALEGACACNKLALWKTRRSVTRIPHYTPSFSSAWWLRDVYVNDVALQADSNSSISEQTF
jgi:hypothetical protein